MELKVFGYTFTVELLILIGILYAIVVSHTFCGCCNYNRLVEGFNVGLVEGFNLLNSNTTTTTTQPSHTKPSSSSTSSSAPSSSSTSPSSSSSSSSLPVPAGSLMALKANSSKNSSAKEGFVGANTNQGQSAPFSLTDTTQGTVNTSSWSAPDMTVVSGQPLSAGVQDVLNRKQQELPLPKGELDFLANVPFKPSCCPNTYSNSSGCACMTAKDYNYLIMRGGNNAPYSEY